MKKSLFRLSIFIFCCFYGAFCMADLTKISSSFSAPTGIAFDSKGVMYVTNWSGNSITKVKPNGDKAVSYTHLTLPTNREV